MSLIKRIHAFFWMSMAYTAIIFALVCGAAFSLHRYMNRETALQMQVSELNGQVSELTGQVAKLKEENEKLALANRLLKVDTRRARIDVISQTENEDLKKVETKFTFQEFEPGGKEIGPAKEFTVLGDTIYLDSLVIKFNDDFVETGDKRRGHSLVTFQGIFGRYQTPHEAFPVDEKNTIPAAYQAENGLETDAEKHLWSRFWEISNSPFLQESFGVRANHGEAPSQRLEPGKSYVVELRASGGLGFRPNDAEK